MTQPVPTTPRPAGTRPPELEILIPAYNEEHRLPTTLRALGAHLSRLPLRTALRVIDNGSSDRTAEAVDRVAAEGVPVTVTGCAQRGKGAAVKRGVTTSPARWTGFCDADLPTPVTAVDHAVRLLLEGWPVVVGSRRCLGAQLPVRQPLHRRLGGAGFRLLTRRLSGRVTDTQCGLKFFRTSVARELFAGVSCTGFAFDVEAIARARTLGVKVVEFPVAWSDQPGSRFRAGRDGLRVAGELWHLHRARHGTQRPTP
ncbi:glycosyltransferase [Streptomyces flavalbus]|uniref:Glycosyltransferase n=1 Tax=Streptomyces flavalbus TaxID=2665155 RepID=A0ABW2WHB6_9ACTN